MWNRRSYLWTPLLILGVSLTSGRNLAIERSVLDALDDSKSLVWGLIDPGSVTFASCVYYAGVRLRAEESRQRTAGGGGCCYLTGLDPSQRPQSVVLDFENASTGEVSSVAIKVPHRAAGYFDQGEDWTWDLCYEPFVIALLAGRYYLTVEAPWTRRYLTRSAALSLREVRFAARETLDCIGGGAAVYVGDIHMVAVEDTAPEFLLSGRSNFTERRGQFLLYNPNFGGEVVERRILSSTIELPRSKQ